MSFNSCDYGELIINKLYHPEYNFILLIIYGNKLEIPINLPSLLDLNRLLYSKYKLVLNNPQFKQVIENDIFYNKKLISKYAYQEFENLDSNYITFLFQQMYYGNGIDVLHDIFIQDGFVIIIDDKKFAHVYIENDISYFTNWLNDFL